MNNKNLEKLTKFLSECNKSQITLSFDDIETIIGEKLPNESTKAQWWWNISSSKRASYWLSIGYKTIDAQYITYRKNVTFQKIEESNSLKNENKLVFRLIYFLCNENDPVRKRIAAILAIPLAIFSILGSLYTIKSYYINNNNQDPLENNKFEYWYETGKKHLEDHNYEEAIKNLELSLETYDDLNLPYNEDALSAFNELGNIYLKISLYNNAIDNYIKAISIIDNLGIDKKDYFDLYINIAYAYVKLTEYNKAEKYLDISKKYFNDDEISSFEQTMIFLYLEYCVNEENEDKTKRTVLTFDLPDGENPLYFDANKVRDYLKIVEVEASIDMRKGNYENAKFRYVQILSFWDYLKVYNIYDNKLKIATLYDSISICNIYLNNTEDARKYNQYATEIFDNELGKRNIDTGISYSNMGIAYLNVNEYEKAYEYLTKSAAIIKDVLGENNDMMATIYNNIGMYFDWIGNYEQAETYYLKSLNIYHLLDIQTINTLRTYINYSFTLIDMNRLNEAKETFNEAYLLTSFLVDESSDEYKLCMEIKAYLESFNCT